MDDFLVTVFGRGGDLTAWQTACRGVVFFVIAIILVRISGRRSFGMHTTFDNVFVVLLGAILSRPIIGASPVIPSVVACLAICILHRLFGWLCNHSKRFERITKGKPILLYRDGKFIQKHLDRGLVSKEDIFEEARLLGIKNMTNVKEMYLERNGKISFRPYQRY